MTKLIQVLVAIALLLLIAILGLHLFEAFDLRKPPTAQVIPQGESHTVTADQGIIDQTLNLGSYTKAAKFSAALSTLTVLKPSVSMFYAQTGAWPNSLMDLGMTQQEVTGQQYIDKITLQGNALYASLASLFTPQATIKLSWQENMDGLSIKWVCETNIKLKPGHINCLFSPDITYPNTASSSSSLNQPATMAQ